MPIGDTAQTCPLDQKDWENHPSSSIWVGRLEERSRDFALTSISDDLSRCESLKMDVATFKQLGTRVKELTGIREIEMVRGNQEMFEAICSLDSLERLTVCGRTITDVSYLGNLNHLTHLRFRHKSQVHKLPDSLLLPKLRSLSLDTQFSDYSGLELLDQATQLKGLILDTSGSYSNGYRSLGPLSNLSKLEFLGILADIKDRAIGPLTKLTALRTIWLGKLSQWEQKDYQLLASGMPSLKGSRVIFKAAKDSGFCKAHRIKC